VLGIAVCYWNVLYPVHVTAFCWGGGAFFSGHRVLNNNITLKTWSLQKLPSADIFHHDLIRPIQYVTFVPEAFSQAVSWLLSDGRPMSLKTASRSGLHQISSTTRNHDFVDDKLYFL